MENSHSCFRHLVTCTIYILNGWAYASLHCCVLFYNTVCHMIRSCLTHCNLSSDHIAVIRWKSNRCNSWFIEFLCIHFIWIDVILHAQIRINYICSFCIISVTSRNPHSSDRRMWIDETRENLFSCCIDNFCICFADILFDFLNLFPLD